MVERLLDVGIAVEHKLSAHLQCVAPFIGGFRQEVTASGEKLNYQSAGEYREFTLASLSPGIIPFCVFIDREL